MLLDIGISIVLAATALEVFISHILNQLAEKKPDLVSPEIWNWFNDREWPLQNPVVKEQFGDLLKMLGGISLKDDSIL